jgi:hypothetical protein
MLPCEKTGFFKPERFNPATALVWCIDGEEASLLARPRWGE